MYYDPENSKMFIHQTTRYTCCVSIDPTNTSIPITSHLAIQSSEWIPHIHPAVTFQELLSRLDPSERLIFDDLTMEVDRYQFLELVDAQDAAGNTATQDTT
jgi:hypothetical protein